RLLVGHAHAVAELGGEAEALRQRRHLWTAPVHDDRLDPDRPQQADVLREPRGEVGILHRRAAQLHDDDLPGVLADVRERLEENAALRARPLANRHRRGGRHGASPVVGSASASSRSNSRFMFWMAWPAAPLTRLSSAATITAVPVRASPPVPSSQTFDPWTCF